MKRLRFNSSRTKKGAASIYVVVFATILFGVITLSFVRIILSEGNQSSNDDLSRSAYDSALAGVEDAKIMVNRYYKCLSENHSGCEEYNVFSSDYEIQNPNFCKNGFPLARKLYGQNYVDANAGNDNPAEVKIQESSSGNNSDQAYTCVIIQDTVPDYRGTLTDDTRTKTVPLGVNREDTGDSADSTSLGQVSQIVFKWYSQTNQGSNNAEFTLADGEELKNYASKTTPPTISLTLIRAPKNINLNDVNYDPGLSNTNVANNTGNSVLYSTMILLPSSGSTSNTISPSEIISAGDVANGDASNQQTPFPVSCTKNNEFACTVTLDVSGLLHDADNAMVVVSLPYGDSFTDFALEMKNSHNETIEFKGVQVSVDSTGRTNQLYRRVETRLDPADLFFPYPQYALELGGDGEDSFRKNFWVTTNCWTENGLCDGGRNNQDL